MCDPFMYGFYSIHLYPDTSNRIIKNDKSMSLLGVCKQNSLAPQNDLQLDICVFYFYYVELSRDI